VAFAPPALFVNEFLAVNTTGIVDEFGQHEDWVEIYNGGQDPITLAGLCLSDQLSVPNKFVFPDTTLDPGGFLLVWCDNDPSRAAARGLPAVLDRRAGRALRELDRGLRRDRFGELRPANG